MDAVGREHDVGGRGGAVGEGDGGAGAVDVCDGGRPVQGDGDAEAGRAGGLFFEGGVQVDAVDEPVFLVGQR